MGMRRAAWCSVMAGVAALAVVPAASADAVDLRVLTVDGHPIPSPGMVVSQTTTDGVTTLGREYATSFGGPSGTRVRAEITGEDVRAGSFVRDPECPLAPEQIARRVAETVATDDPQTVDIVMPQTVARLTAPEVSAHEAELVALLNTFRAAGGLPPFELSPLVSRVADALATRAADPGGPLGVGENCASVPAMAFELGVAGAAGWGAYGYDDLSGPDMAAKSMTSGESMPALRNPHYGSIGVAYVSGRWFTVFAVPSPTELHPLPARPRSGLSVIPSSLVDDPEAPGPKTAPRRCARITSTRRPQGGVRVSVTSTGRLTVRAPRGARVRLGTRTLRLKRGRAVATLPRGRTQALRVTVRRKAGARTTVVRVAGACR